MVHPAINNSDNVAAIHSRRVVKATSKNQKSTASECIMAQYKKERNVWLFTSLIIIQDRMIVLFIANLELNENEGIYKKIFAQANGLQKELGEGYLLTKSGKESKLYDFDLERYSELRKSVLDAAYNLIVEKQIDIVYVRHMIPSCKLIRLLSMCKDKQVKVFYEIPTYPYYAEQFRTANKKYRAIVKLGLDTLFWPFIYSKVYRLVVIKSSTSVKMYEKMVEITNGADVNAIEEKKYLVEDNSLSDKFRMVAVGTLYPYHGYDRVLKGMKACNEKINDIDVEMHFVGESPTIEELKGLAKSLGLKNVFFHGIKTTQELNDLYDQFDIGLGCLALHRRNADIDTTIKIIEYYCRGVPVVTSGISPMDECSEKYTIHVSNDDSNLFIGEIYHEYQKINSKEKVAISKVAKTKFSWDNIMKKLMIEQL